MPGPWICRICHGRHTNPTTHICSGHVKPRPQPITSKLAIITERMDQHLRETAEIQEQTITSLSNEYSILQHEHEQLIEDAATTAGWAEQLEQRVQQLEHQRTIDRRRYSAVMMRMDELVDNYRRRLTSFADFVMRVNELHGTNYVVERDHVNIPIRPWDSIPNLDQLLETSTEEEEMESEDEMFRLDEDM